MSIKNKAISAKPKLSPCDRFHKVRNEKKLLIEVWARTVKAGNSKQNAKILEFCSQMFLWHLYNFCTTEANPKISYCECRLSKKD